MTRYIPLILGFFIFNSQFLFSQKQGQERIDSLLMELQKAKEDTNKVKLLNDLSFENRGMNPDIGIKYGEMGYKLAINLNWKKGMAAAFRTLGVCNAIKTNYPKALEYFEKSLKKFEEIGDNRGVAVNYGNFANIYYNLGEINKALEYNLKAVKINEEISNKTGNIAILSNIGSIYESQSNYARGLEYYFKSLRMAEEISDKRGIGNNYGHIGTIYLIQADFSKALEYYNKALKIGGELGDKSFISDQLWGIGRVFFEKSDYSKALEYYLKVLKIAEENGDKKDAADMYLNIGNVYLEQSNYVLAFEYFFKSLRIFKEIKNKKGTANILCNLGNLYLNKISNDTNILKINERNSYIGLNKEANQKLGIKYLLESIEIYKNIGNLSSLILCYNNLYKGYKDVGNPSKALEYLELSKVLQDSVFNIEKAKQLKTLEVKRETLLKEKEIQVKNFELEKKNWQLLCSVTSILLMLIFSIFVIRERRKSDRLLLNILPVKIANRLKKKEHPIADNFDEATIVFVDMVDFTKKSAGASAKRVVEVLNILYSKLDRISKKNGLEKIKTIGDCYMAASGIPISDSGNTIKAAQFALEAMELLENYDTGDGTILNFRCGVDCGPVVAGVIGENKFIYDIWGDAVNTAARMQEYSEPGKIQVTERFKEKLLITNDKLLMKFEERGEIEIKGKGMMRTWFLTN